jgi:ADP-ribose pyrophosphatase
MNDTPTLIASTRLFTGRVFNVRSDEVRYDDGSTHRIDVVEHRGAYGIIACPSANEIVLVRQYRHAVGRSLWEIPAGTAEAGEDAIDGARRELREETGYVAGDVRSLGTLFTTPGFCTEPMHFFHASKLIAGAQDLEEDERIAVASFTLENARKLVQIGEIADAKTVLGLLWLNANWITLGLNFAG